MSYLAKPAIAGGTAKDNRLFIEAVLWIARTASPWRDLDPALGKLACDVYALLAVGQERRVAAVIAAIRHDAGLEALLIDSTVVRANQHAAGAQKRRPASVRALARRAEHEDSYHGRCAGNPLRWFVTGGEVADITQAPALSEGLNTQAVIGDKGYDACAGGAHPGRGRYGGDPAAQLSHRSTRL